MPWAFAGCYQQGDHFAWKEAERELQQVKGFHSPITVFSCHDHGAVRGRQQEWFPNQKESSGRLDWGLAPIRQSSTELSWWLVAASLLS